LQCRQTLQGTNAKGEVIDHGDKINWAVFPGLQGGPHNHTIAALTVALHEAQSQDFKQNAIQTIANCKAFAEQLVSRDFKLVSGGTDNHLVLADLRGKGLDGSRAEKVLELVNISCNKNTVPGDKSAMTPSGLRMGTPAITTRGMKEGEMKVIADFVHRGIGIAQDIKAKNPGNLKVFTEALAKGSSDIDRLRDDVTKLSRQFPVPSFSS
jgi:glycine hydroxymethyltransferase